MVVSVTKKVVVFFITTTTAITILVVIQNALIIQYVITSWSVGLGIKFPGSVSTKNITEKSIYPCCQISQPPKMLDI